MNTHTSSLDGAIICCTLLPSQFVLLWFVAEVADQRRDTIW